MPPLISPTPVVVVLTALFFIFNFGHKSKIYPWLEAQSQEPTARSEALGLAKGIFNAYGVIAAWRIFIGWGFPVPPLPDILVLLLLEVLLGVSFFLLRRWVFRKVVSSFTTPSWRDDYPLILEIFLNTLSFYAVLNDLFSLLW
jgi:hypothetical protein